MLSDGLNRWILLLNKSPKGPLSEEEIRALLTQGIVRRNDIAYLIPPPGDNKAQTEWKLLWQFPQFDRRGDQPAVKKPMETAERRIEPAVDPRTEAFTQIPQDLLNIAPEDLLPKSTGMGMHYERESFAELTDSRPLLAKIESHSRNTWLFGGFSFVILGLIGWVFYPGQGANRFPVAADPTTLSEPERAPTASVPRQAMRVLAPASIPTPPAAAPRTPEEAPVIKRHEPEILESDSGEIVEEDQWQAEENPDDLNENREDLMRRPKNPRDRPNMGMRRKQDSMRRPPARLRNDDEGIDDGSEDPEADGAQDFE